MYELVDSVFQIFRFSEYCKIDAFITRVVYRSKHFLVPLRSGLMYIVLAAEVSIKEVKFLKNTDLYFLMLHENVFFCEAKSSIPSCSVVYNVSHHTFICRFSLHSVSCVQGFGKKNYFVPISCTTAQLVTLNLFS
jgi:hypothetical protein